MSEPEEGAATCKVVLIGESGVGKTSIISRYTNNTFKSQLMSTPGANFVTKNIILEDENQSIKFEIWDTAGQERYRALAKVFYKNAAVCVLVYDITRKTSFNELKNYWYKENKMNSNEIEEMTTKMNKMDEILNKNIFNNPVKEANEKMRKELLEFKKIFNKNLEELSKKIEGGNIKTNISKENNEAVEDLKTALEHKTYQVEILKKEFTKYEEKAEDEGLAFAKELNAIYKRTSAKVAQGGLIDELFKDIGKKFLHPDSEITSNMTNEELKNKGEKLQREKIKNEQKKRNCC